MFVTERGQGNHGESLDRYYEQENHNEEDFRI